MLLQFQSLGSIRFNVNNDVETVEIAMTIGGASSSNMEQRSMSYQDNKSCFANLCNGTPSLYRCNHRILNVSGGNRGFHRNTNANDRYTSLSGYLIG